MVLVDKSTIKYKCPDNLYYSYKTKFHPNLSRDFDVETLMHDV